MKKTIFLFAAIISLFPAALPALDREEFSVTDKINWDGKVIDNAAKAAGLSKSDTDMLYINLLEEHEGGPMSVIDIMKACKSMLGDDKKQLPKCGALAKNLPAEHNKLFGYDNNGAKIVKPEKSEKRDISVGANFMGVGLHFSNTAAAPASGGVTVQAVQAAGGQGLTPQPQQNDMSSYDEPGTSGLSEQDAFQSNINDTGEFETQENVPSPPSTGQNSPQPKNKIETTAETVKSINKVAEQIFGNNPVTNVVGQVCDAVTGVCAKQ
jgi:hypothetical protein